MSIHGDFLIDIFATVLGYKRLPEDPKEWNLSHEQTTCQDATAADGALGFFSPESDDIRAVIELKSAKTDLDAKQRRKNDNRTPVEQAFSYVPKSGKKCNWVIVSNYIELRIYHAKSSGEYETFSIAGLTDETKFKRFYYLLSVENLIAKDTDSVIDSLYKRNEAQGENISKKFYSEYKRARLHLFEHMKKLNPDKCEFFLLEKTQKLLDRFIFVCFCEDTGLLPENIFRKVIKYAKESFSFAEDRIWKELKGLFSTIDKGYPDKSINAFNGGLFAEDPGLNSLRIDDEVFEELALITDYDFDSDLNVNILGHIFEQSISDLEELRAEIKGEEIDRKKGKRKKEGIFYTPEYITRYIVENAVGGWLEDRKEELGIDDLPEFTEKDYNSIRVTKKGKVIYNKIIGKHIKFWEAYKKKLANIKVLDPACGSGAFLNQTFNFLHKEGKKVNGTLANLRRGYTTVTDLDKHILSNNLYGVDLNRESVDITKLSLWIKTANKSSALTALDNKIKCGNSLIDDPEIAEDKAFKWEVEFPEIIQNGGFDVVMGNPPYVNIGYFNNSVLNFLKNKYSDIHTGYNDLMYYFIYKGINLLNSGGIFSYINSNYFLGNSYAGLLRLFLKNHITEIINFEDYHVFQDANIHTAIIKAYKKPISDKIVYYQIKEANISNLNLEKDFICFQLNRAELATNWIIADNYNNNMIKKINQSCKLLGKISEIAKGSESGKNEIFTINQEIALQYNIENELLKKCIKNSDINRYFIKVGSKLLIYTNSSFSKTKFPNAFNYLTKYKEILLKRRGPRTDEYEWWRLHRPSIKEVFNANEKLIVPYRAKKNKFAYDNLQLYNDGGDIRAIVIKDTNYDSKYILSILNSNLMDWFYGFIGKPKGNAREYFNKPLAQIPIKVILKEKQQPFIEKADKMLTLNKEFYEGIDKFNHFIASTYNPQKGLLGKLKDFYTLSFNEFIRELKKQKVSLTKKYEFELMDVFEQEKDKILTLKSEIKNTDKEIDKMVYELYGLTEEEVKIVDDF